jgi:hypothetical protein
MLRRSSDEEGLIMANLKQTALCIDAAKCLYYLGAAYHGAAVRDFDLLPAATKHKLVEDAEIALDAVGPYLASTGRPDYFNLAAGMARKESARVLAVIRPETPWGDPVVDPRD